MRIVIKKPARPTGVEALYKNLRVCFESLVTEILGEDYYTMCCDVYGSDLECHSDMLRNIKHMKQSLKNSRILNVILIICLILALIF